MGIAPDLAVKKEDSLPTAELLLNGSGDREDKSGYIQLQSGPNTFEINLDRAGTSRYWQAYDEILDALSSSSALKRGTGEGWEEVTGSDLECRWPLYYPDYMYLGELAGVPVDKRFTIRFSGEVDWRTVNNESVELIDIDTGERAPLDFQRASATEVRAIPRANLKPGATYWLVVHRSAGGVNGRHLKCGALAAVTVKGADAGAFSLQYRSSTGSEQHSGQNSGYGRAILAQ